MITSGYFSWVISIIDSSSLRRAKRLRHALHSELPLLNKHDGHARNFSQAALEVPVARRNNIAAVLFVLSASGLDQESWGGGGAEG